MGVFRSILSYPALRKARAAARRKDWKDAIRHYRSVVKILPDSHRIWIQLGHALKENQELDRAERAYRTAIIKAPRQVEGYRELAFFLRRAKRPLEAQLAAAAGLVVRQDAAELRRELGELGLPEDLVESKMELGRLIVHAMRRRSIGMPPSRLLRRARSAARKRRWDDAVIHYERLLKRNPANSLGRIQMAHALKENGDIEAAINAYREAVEWDPLLSDAHLEFGHALRRIGERERARSSFANALKLDPSLAEARRALAEFAIDTVTAEAMLQTAWSAPPDPSNIGADGAPGNDGHRLTIHRPSRPHAPPERLAPRERQLWLILAQRLLPN